VINVPASPATPKARFTRKRVLSGAVLILLMAVGAWIYAQRVLNAPNPQASDLERQMAGLSPGPPAVKEWHEVRRQTTINQTVDLHGYSGWMASRNVAAPANFKYFMLPKCEATDAEHVRFVVMDQDNFERMKSGYPPIAIASQSIQEPEEIEAPNGVYWFGFVEATSPPSAPGSIPTSLSGALIYLLNESQKQNRPPIRLSVQIDTITKFYGTASDATRIADAIKQKTVQN
jgi:hypothetical protein